jgi:lipopolysaccharide/colanic/teichoic acid biosynthesis glycosyltransferase
MYQGIKRVADIVIAAIAVVLLCPLFFIVWLAIRLSSPGAAVFKQQRAGKNGVGFTFYKFRTMRMDADPFGPSPKSGEDARITKVGRLLREYSLDELPQLVNVLQGDMSIVGPRPLYISQMAEWNERQKRRLLVKPGLTGLAQISGRGEITIEEKLNLDVRYVDSACFWLDVKIFFTTIAQVFGKKSIYEKNYSKTESTRGDKHDKRT